MRNVNFSIEPWEMKEPFRITGYTFTEMNLLHVIIEEDGFVGHGEATGVYYTEETAKTILTQANVVREALEADASKKEIQNLLPSGGARNAIDCALWDLEAKKSGKTIWELTGIEPQPVVTVNTVGVGTPEEMAAKAKSFETSRIKVKLDGEIPLERISAVCSARPDADIVVDVNQGWTFEQLVDLAPQFKELGIAMIEQPLKRGHDQELEGYMSPLPLCADESCLDSSELEQASKRYQMINIKLDKTGGLTEALELAKQAKKKGLDLMVGNMVGTSLAMAPGFVIAQMCKYVDLDGALFLKKDRDHAMSYDKGIVSVPDANLWG